MVLDSFFESFFIESIREKVELKEKLRLKEECVFKDPVNMQSEK